MKKLFFPMGRVMLISALILFICGCAGTPDQEWSPLEHSAQTEMFKIAPGDIIAIDNTRFMHGRQAVVDDDRRILTRFGFPQWVEPSHEFGAR